MILGVDLDNTIVCFDDLFPALAIRRGLVPPGTAGDKRSVRDHLRAAGREPEWTTLQGLAYGPEMPAARPFPGVREAFARLRASGVLLRIVSHRTLHAIAGERHDLHRSAMEWLERWGFFSGESPLAREDVFLETTKEAKLARIGTLSCGAFVDDLPELLLAPTFPGGVRRVLFAPAGGGADGLALARSWKEVEAIVLGSAAA